MRAASAGGGLFVTNHGTITARNATAVDFSSITSGGAAILINTGLMQEAGVAFIGDNGIDTLLGGDGAEQINGDAHLDTIRGGGGDDTRDAFESFDSVQGGAGEDTSVQAADTDGNSVANSENGLQNFTALSAADLIR